MNNSLLVEVVGAACGTVASLLLVVLFINRVSRRGGRLSESPIVQWYLRLVPVKGDRLRILPIYGVIAVAFAALVIGIPSLSPIREAVRVAFPWMLAIYVASALVITARRRTRR